jgi:glyoxylase-like metal-dependent hydrolase (beta-lactamase superfamily II)
VNSNVDEIAADVFRISTFHPDFGIQFNQFLIRDEEPVLFHTGMQKMFALTRDAVAKVIDPTTLRWIGFSHFEPDECGALNEWLALAPRAQAMSSFVGVTVMLNDYALRPARALADGETLTTGKRRLKFLSTPHVPHGWDSGLLFEESEKTLFCSDLFFHPGDPLPLDERDVVGPAEAAIVEGQNGPLAGDLPYTAHTDGVLRRVAALEPRTLAVMHGSSYRGDGKKALLDLAGVLRRTHAAS